MGFGEGEDAIRNGRWGVGEERDGGVGGWGQDVQVSQRLGPHVGCGMYHLHCYQGMLG